MKKTIYIYDNDRQTTGVYVSEKLTKSYQGGDCEEIVIEIPDKLEPYETEAGETMIKLGDYFYSLDECLRLDRNDFPYLKQMDPAGHVIKLKVIERIGRKSLAFTL